jgi:Ser/Thr protein kinase RdoA (MazF antagonist)
MELSIAEDILKAFGLSFDTVSLQQIGSGHINRTYLLSTQSEEKYILQNINTHVFNDPYAIAHNIKAVADFLKTNYPNYLFPAPIATIKGELMFHYNDEYWRLLPFVANTVALDTLSNPTQAYQAAKQFGKLSKLLNNFDAAILKPTIPGFHDLKWRYEQFTFSLSNADEQLKANAKEQIEIALNLHYIVDYYRSFEQSKNFPNRVMHHDTKISNVLLNETDFSGVCVIDLDTLMPGKFISDLGDMMRTYLCAFSENETDLDKINIRLDYFKATIEGYLSEMAEILTSTEKELILFSGKYIVYMQALRFLTDYLNGSIYYPISYPEQNLDRTKNQFKLLSELSENEEILQGIIEDCL